MSIMLAVYLKRYRNMILCSLFFFYFGCGLTLSLLRMDCAEATSRTLIGTETKEFTKADYVVLILSGPDNNKRRDTIRATWKNFGANFFYENGERLYKWNHTWTGKRIPQDFIKFYFVIGVKGLQMEKLLKLTSENSRNNDLLLLENLMDSYQNLSEKILKSLVWFSDNLSDLKYLIKCDDDSFVRVDLIVKDLEAFAPGFNAPEISQYVSYKNTDLTTYRGVYWGYFCGRSRVRLTGKWREQKWFLCDTYLPYALGGAYIISASIVNYVARNAEFLSKYHSEDVSMAVWTSSLDAINRVHDVRFDTEWKSRGCFDKMLVRHKQTTSEMFEMYKNLVQSQGKKLCSKEMEERKTYLYDWNVLPSNCCHNAVTFNTFLNAVSVDRGSH